METTLPYAWYSDPAILRSEQERIFRGTWQYVGHLGELPGPATFFTSRAGDDDRRPAGAAREERGGSRQLPEVADVLPRAAEDALLLRPEDRRIAVPGVRERRLHSANLATYHA